MVFDPVLVFNILSIKWKKTLIITEMLPDFCRWEETQFC